ncbi:MAG: PAS domain S-box protein [Candidatus Omnitrophica bacterium]|nr:PAS domain S-box protein [Candidatus Omnitrophota bacterium]
MIDGWDAAFDSIEDLISIHDNNFCILKVNKAFSKSVGIPPGKLIGRKCYEVMHAANGPRLSCCHKLAIEGKESKTEENFEPLLKKFFQVSCSPIFDNNKKIIGTVHIARDITGLKRAEERLRQHSNEIEEQLKVIAENAPVFLLQLNRQGHIDYINHAFPQFESDEILGKPFVNFISPEFRPLFLNMLKEVNGEKKFIENELQFAGNHNEPPWYRIKLSPIYRKRTLDRFLVICTDISEIKGKEFEIEKQRQEIIHAHRVLALNEFASSLAHEINQPLTAILSNAQAAQRILSQTDPSLMEFKEIVADIVLATNRAAEVIHRLRKLIKKGEVEFIKLDINMLVNDTVLLLSSNALIKNKFLKTELTPGLPAIIGDRIQLQQVLLNLIMNGLDAMVDAGPEAKDLVIRTSLKDPKTVVVAVEDSGHGFPKSSLGKPFDHFFTTKTQGMGLGLPISFSIVQAHGGQLIVKNKPAGGATVYFSLPVSKDD